MPLYTLRTLFAPQWQVQLEQLLPEEMQLRSVQCEAAASDGQACDLGHAASADKLSAPGSQHQRSQRAGASAACLCDHNTMYLTASVVLATARFQHTDGTEAQQMVHA